jgi:hypothetical protein
MNYIFITSREVEFSYADKTPKRAVEQSHFQILLQLSENRLFPEIYVDLLTSLQNIEDRNELAKKFLKIYLYASTKIKDSNKLYKWLLKGALPQSSASESESMSQLSQSIKKINQLTKSKDKEIDRITKTREKLSKKSTNKLEESLNRGQEKLSSIEELFSSQKQIIENIILEIETSLGSGRKL